MKLHNKPNYTLKWLFFGFAGRIRRSTYMWSAVLIVMFHAYVLIQIVTTPEDSIAFGLWGLVFLGLLLVSIWTIVALSAKRLHDIGFSGFLALAMFIPMVALICFGVLCFLPGQPGRNRFGESPLIGAR